MPSPWVFSFSIAVLLFPLPETLAAAVSVEVSSGIQTANAPRIGLNLGERSVFGAAQLTRNILANPGFEGVVDRTVVVVAHPGSQVFDDDMSWSGRPDGFWAGASFNVRSGQSAGKAGLLADSKKRGDNGLPTFATQEPAPPLAAGDAVIVTRIDDQSLPTAWLVPRDTPAGQVAVDLGDRRPGSTGKRSLALIAQPGVPKRYAPPARVTAYFDSLGARAGKLLPVEGRWQFSVWARSQNGNGNLRITFQRQGSPKPFLRETVKVARDWQRLEFAFDAKDEGPVGNLSLELAAEDDKILLDDASLAKADGGDGAFRAEVVSVLEKLKPGYLRDWQGQLGDTWENLTAAPEARRTDRYRPGPEDRYGYSLPEFLDLCQKIGANPWLIAPTTFDDAEYEAFGRYVAGRIQQSGFAEAVVEFGNENWNAIFRSGGFTNPHLHGLVAQRAFNAIRKGAGPNAPIRLAVNGQEVNTNFALQMLDSTPNADMLAVAPYILHNINRADFTDAPWPLMFEADPNLPAFADSVKKRGKELAVYEVNYHTTGGNLDPATREQIVAGAAAGSGLAQRLVEALNVGVRRQCVYNLAQYDFAMPDRNFVKLWGILRDLGPTQRMRPTGLALAMLNRALPGDVLAVSVKGADSVTAAAVRRKDGIALVLVSASPQPQEVAIRLPKDGKPPARLLRLEAANPAASNENAEDVKVSEQALAKPGQDFSVTVPVWGLLVLMP